MTPDQIFEHPLFTGARLTWKTAALAAEWYASSGIRVFPVHSVENNRCSCGKPDCSSPAKHPRTARGLKDATTDTEQVRAWWKVWPTANIGAPTGGASGFIVIDVDPRHGGDRALAELEAKHGQLPKTQQSRTGGGGWHLFFAANGKEYRNSASAIGVGLDVRGAGGYVLLPPSGHISGQAYRWLSEAKVKPAISPPWLEQLLANPPRKARQPDKDPGNKVPQGRRDDFLCSRAGTYRARGMDEESIFVSLHGDNQRCDPPLSENDLRRIARSVARYETPDTPGRVLVTEKSNAERLIALSAADLRFASDRGVWCVWHGHFWAVDDQCGALRLTTEACRQIYFEAGREDNDKMRTALSIWAQKSEGRKVLENSLAMSRFDSRIEVPRFSAVFDRDPLLLNVSNGTVDLCSGQLREHRRDDFITKLIPIPYDPSATCPRFTDFLNSTFASAEMVDYVQRLFGYCLTGQTSEQSMWLFHGVTASGKSTLIKIMRAIAGPYAQALPENFFLLNRNGATDYTTAQLAGVRLATCVETAEGKLLDVAKIKAITGQDSIRACLKYQNLFEFEPTCKLVLATNHAPRIPSSDDSIWRRLKVVGFRRTVPEHERIPNLAETLIERESPGILAWAVTGCRAWLQSGLGEPGAVKAAVDQYRVNEDLVQNFIAERCELDLDQRIPRKEIFNEFSKWLKDQGLRPWSQKRFSNELVRLGFEGDPGNRFWLGVTIGL